ncbi:MAG TPA: hypothetical protein VD706_00665, partial [Candidatus Saccharimonadales bacterium]|nr:hypothetical protein [Candidatus Saccharimonadales bacterium]
GGPQLANTNTTKQDEKALSEIDMNLDEDDDAPKAHDFTDDRPMPNIWAIHGEDDDSDGKDRVVSGSLEDDLEKPSFLRRLGRRRKEEPAPESEKPEEPAEPAKPEEAKETDKNDGTPDEKDKS